MKKYLEIAVGAMAVVGAVASTPALAVDVCSGSASGASYNMTTSSTSFVSIPFTGKCSANVFLSYSDSQTVMAAGAASKKGKNVFAGHTNGGGVRPTGTICPATGCTATETGAAAGTALTNSSS
jgi:hypothetical protein